MRVDIFTDHNRIVDHNAECDQKREQGKHVQRLIKLPQHSAGTKDGDWNSQRDPECQAKLQKQRQHNKDEYQPLRTITPQQIQAVTNVDSSIAPCRDFITRRQLHRDHIFIHRVGHGQQVFPGGRFDGNCQTRLTVDAADGNGVDKLVLDNTQITNCQRNAVTASNQGNTRNLFSQDLFVFSTQQVRFPVILDVATGKFEVTHANPPRHFGQCQPIFPQRLFRNLDIDLKFPFAGDLSDGNLRYLQQACSNTFGDFTQLQFRRSSI